jgi:GntR family transcriptional regulator
MRTAAAGPAPATAGAEEQLSRQYPKYYVVKGHLAEMLALLGPGQALPPERALAESFSTSRTTIRQALRELTIEGRLVRMQGRGTFAALPKVAQPLQLTSYTEDMRRQGLAASSRLLAVGHVNADDELARRLDVRPHARVVRIERLRMAREEPMAIETTHLDASRFPGLAKRLGGSGSLYALLASEYGVHLAAAEETIETVPAPPKEAELLDTTVGYPMLLLSRHSRDTSGRPVEFALSFYRGDRYKFVAQLRPPEVTVAGAV